jgi:DNA-directed RNA polymerase subunit RPC12/RpoP
MIDIDLERVMDAIEEDGYIGFCLECGEEAAMIEPDARNYTCENCGAAQVFGAEEILLSQF